MTVVRDAEAELAAEERAAEIFRQADRAPAEPQDHSRRGHSPLGASGAERWMKCPGSVELLKRLDLGESDEPDYRRIGTAMHEAAATALLEELESYELVGSTYNDTKITADLATPIGVYLDYCRRVSAAADAGDVWIEYAISSPVHPAFYGTADFGTAVIEPDGKHVLYVVDLKGGEGLAVEVEDNPQLKYYAFGLIDGLERQYGRTMRDEHTVRLAIAQPRIEWHPDGQVREWDTTVGEIKAWIHGTLVPAMNATQFDDRLDAGEHCRFCPAKLVCPLLTAMFGAGATANAKHIPDMTNETLGLNYKAAEAVKHYIRALEREALDRQMRGAQVPGIKLVRKKANRVFKPGAVDIAKGKFGDDAWKPRELKSPAELEKLPAAKEWVKEWAYSPDTGLTVALADDSRLAVKVTQGSEVFKAYLEKAE